MPATICREKYFNYGSYLRSRGYDKEICNLVSNIENGNIKVGSFIPNGTNGGTINGNLKIVSGTLDATGGANATGAGESASTFKASATMSHGIEVTGLSLLNGMIYQSINGDVSGNIFSVPATPAKHLFTATSGVSTHVDISGRLSVSNDVSLCDVSGSLAFFNATGSTQGTSAVNTTTMVIDASGAIDLSGAGSIIGQNTTFAPSGGETYSIQDIVQILYNYGLLK
jgi:hypothetical protein